MKRISLVLFFLLVCLPFVFAQKIDPPSAVPCCGIVSIDRVNGIVTARILKTGKTFKFEVDSRSLLKTLRVGQKVWVDAGTRKVSMMDGEPCCTIVGPADLSGVVRLETNDGEPCCAIIAVDKLKGMVTARNTTTARTFQFRATPVEIGALNVGDSVNANLTRGSLTSLKGVTKTAVVFEPADISPCCDIVNVQFDAEPCCDIVSVKNNLTGNVFQFRIGNSYIGETEKNLSVARSLKTGQAISLDTSGTWAMVQSSAAAGMQGRPATYSYRVTKTDSDRTLVSSPVRWEIKPGAEMKGSSGQIVIQFPGMTSSGNNYVAVFEVGGKDRISTATYGNKSFPLLDGEYDVEVNSVRVSRVPVKRGMDTRIHIGTMRFDVPSNVSVEVYDKTLKTRLCLSYGSVMCGAPSGEYVVKVGGSSRRVSIADGQVIDF